MRAYVVVQLSGDTKKFLESEGGLKNLDADAAVTFLIGVDGAVIRIDSRTRKGIAKIYMKVRSVAGVVAISQLVFLKKTTHQ